ncbi:MAG: ABC transporter ATP-binding protein [Hyphomicrobiaceae bacterium]|nr:MAG: ABC transporter ATP-binding protein [Hyphomicrobiaceae bacterium]
MTARTALQAAGLQVSLKGRQALAGVTVDFACGSLSVVIGPNGAGKSTLLKCCAGLIAPIGGTVSLRGEPVLGLTPRERARQIAYLPQERVVYWPLAVRDVVGLGRLPHLEAGDWGGRRHAEAVDRALAIMSLRDLAARPVRELSGGELARVLVARALAQETQFVIADEPAAGLDPSHQLELFATFQALTRRGRAVIVAMHELSLAARYADHIALLSAGRVLAAGAPRDVLTRERIAAAFGVNAFVGEVEGVPVVLPLAAR